jgi:hypothetical protein
MEAKKGSIITGGKVSILTVVLGVLVLLFGVFGELPHGNVARAAQNATTSVTVLNTPPQWDTTVYAYESTASASTTPTNAGSVITWVASSSDSSNDNYYLLICSNYASPTPNSGAAPTCSGGAANRLAGSGATASGVMATAATTTQAYQSEINYWYAYICDGAASNPSCNISAWNGSTTPILDNVPAHSPFIVNHRPTFTLFVNYAGTYPGATSTWYSTSSDPDTLGGFATDTVTLLVCRAADFSGTTCGIGGSWGTSTSVVADATTTYHLANPYPKGYFGGYGHIPRSSLLDRDLQDDRLLLHRQQPMWRYPTIRRYHTSFLKNQRHGIPRVSPYRSRIRPVYQDLKMWNTMSMLLRDMFLHNLQIR